MDIIIVPTYNRPELLWLTLEHLAACPEAQLCSVWVCVDCHNDEPLPPMDEIGEVVGLFPQLKIQVDVRPAHPYHGNSYNVMTAYADAAKTDAEFIYLIEDDVLINRDFFWWHIAAQVLHQPFCSVAAENTRSAVTDNFVTSNKDYASLGVCFPRASVEAIAQHAKHEYFANMPGYVIGRFGAMFEGDSYEQDGLILRVMGARHGQSVWTNEPKAQHVGWFGYHRHRSRRPLGTLVQRKQQVQMVLTTPGLLSMYEKDFGDIRPIGGN